jgi:hypothetical protein
MEKKIHSKFVQKNKIESLILGYIPVLGMDTKNAGFLHPTHAQVPGHKQSFSLAGCDFLNNMPMLLMSGSWRFIGV